MRFVCIHNTIYMFNVYMLYVLYVYTCSISSGIGTSINRSINRGISSSIKIVQLLFPEKNHNTHCAIIRLYCSSS